MSPHSPLLDSRSRPNGVHSTLPADSAQRLLWVDSYRLRLARADVSAKGPLSAKCGVSRLDSIADAVSWQRQSSSICCYVAGKQGDKTAMIGVSDSGQKTSAWSSGRSPVTAFIDRWIWVFMALLILATVLSGFVPDSIRLVRAVESGAKPPLPIVLHVHAVLMGTWIILLLAQTSLMATGSRRWHMRLGAVAVFLVPAIVVTGIVLVPTMYAVHLAQALAAHPHLAFGEVLPETIFDDRATLYLIRPGILFPVLIAIALHYRRTDPATHKRLTILATTVLLTAATVRISWLPTTLPDEPLSADLYPILLVTPMFAWDLVRLRRVHRAYIIWLSLLLPSIIVIHLLWNSSWWFATVPKMMGVA